MISTIDQAYTQFLYGIDKEGTTPVYPEKFNALFNEAQALVVNEIAEGAEVNELRIEDLSDIRVQSDETTDEELPLDVFKILRVEFRVKPKDWMEVATIDTGGTERTSSFFNGKPMRADLKAMAVQNPYRSVKRVFDESEIYYEIVGNNFKLVDHDFYSYRLDYFKHPRNAFFGPTEASHIHSELRPRVQQVIVDRAVRIFLERTESVRYQSALNEDSMKNI